MEGIPMRISTIVLTYCFFLIFPIAYADNALQPVEIAIGEFKPFVTQSMEGYGEVTERVTVILERMGYRPNYVFMPWGQAEVMVKENQSNIGLRATFTFISTDKRRGEFLFSSKPIFKARMGFFYNKDKTSESKDISISTLKDLEEYKIGFVGEGGGYQYSKELNKVLTNKDKSNIQCNSLFDAFKKLLDPNDSVQIVPAALKVGQELLYELFPEQRFSIAVIKNNGMTSGGSNYYLLPVNYYFLVSNRNPNNAELMRKFDVEHSTIDTETIERIKRKAYERPSPQNPEVILNAYNSTEDIKAFDADDRIHFLPRGTRGLLLDWNPMPCIQINYTPTEAIVRVISGPYRGKTLTVNGRFVILQ